jgi:hypothetical protein
MRATHFIVTLSAITVLVFGRSAEGLILGAMGNDPVPDSGWPAGAHAIANREDRIGYWEGPPFGGGEYHFLLAIESDQAMAQLLDEFAAIVAPDKQILLRDEPLSSFWLTAQSEDASNLTAEFVIWTPERWNVLHRNPLHPFMMDSPNCGQPCPPPQLIVSTPAFQGIDWSDLPTSCTIVNQHWRGTRTEGEAARSFELQVFDINSHKPLPHVTVTTEHQSEGDAPAKTCTTDAQGRARLVDLPRGAYRLTLSAEGYAPRRVEPFPGERDFNSTTVVYLAPAHALTGRVSNTDGKPVAEAAVRIIGLLGIDGLPYPRPRGLEGTETDAEGLFRMDALPQGYCQIIVMHREYPTAGHKREIIQIPAESLTITLQPPDTAQPPESPEPTE